MWQEWDRDFRFEMHLYADQLSHKLIYGSWCGPTLNMVYLSRLMGLTA